ncbi:MAG: hypothetical protein C4539_11570 [Ignavibacteriales bacterium]|nr:MAG: hypothetical protein C4539_11570 [Ignavibacteriales bacterium]
MNRKVFPLVLIIIFIFNTLNFSQSLKPTSNASSWFKLIKQDLRAGEHHKRHSDIFGKSVDGYNSFIIRAIDIVQSKAMDGGGYFAQLNADPPEAPTGYSLQLFNSKLIEPARTTSYCSGSTYSVFVEAMNLIFPDRKLDDEKIELLKMQEPDGGRREDHVKMWGEWNADGFGNHFALVQYSQVGKRVKPDEAKPGDFMNISWKTGGGHSVIFLGWYVDEEGKKNVVYWSSQKATNGFGDQVIPLERIEEICVVRLTDPEKIFSFTPPQKMFYGVKGDKINW